MRKTGKIVAAVVASICIVVSLITAVYATMAKVAQGDPETFRARVYERMLTNMPESNLEQAEATAKTIVDYTLELNHRKVLSQGIVGAILSIIILVTVLINLPNTPIVPPAIASIASLVGAIYCGWVIMIFMVVTLIGSGLVLIANLQR
ncbi:MAG: hypothetical protein F4W92_08150 [Gammaproteobacteria bacterium]|nr:hypothetical protein [Gammaproteobacteria bacterium]